MAANPCAAAAWLVWATPLPLKAAAATLLESQAKHPGSAQAPPKAGRATRGLGVEHETQELAIAVPFCPGGRLVAAPTAALHATRMEWPPEQRHCTACTRNKAHNMLEG